MADSNYGRNEKDVKKGSMWPVSKTISGAADGDHGIPPGIKTSGSEGNSGGKVDSGSTKGNKGVPPMGHSVKSSPAPLD